MKPGTKPKPTALKKLAGNPGKRAMNKQEPRLPADMPECPDRLSDSAKVEWHRIAGELHKAGVITRVDMAILAAYCDAYARWLDILDELDSGELTYTTDKGNLVQSPLVGMANTLRLQVVRIAAELGITPSSRSRVNAINNSDDDELERSLFGRPVKINKD